MYCAGSTIPALPTTSNNGVTGTWTPPINNTTTTTYTFTPTAGQCATTTQITITVKPLHTIIATASNGSISPSGTVEVCDGDPKTFTFTPDECYQIAEVTVNGEPVTPTGNTYTFGNVTADYTIHVTFEIITYDITVSANPPEGGAITGGGTDIECGTDITLTAIPDDCYNFVNWTEGGTEVSTNPV
ncbi:MAG: hypothetical protein FWF09_04630, partial [Bacteroidales bacterium]|nr:hypothetical protein [Bacteroidales bacterium]